MSEMRRQGEAAGVLVAGVLVVQGEYYVTPINLFRFLISFCVFLTHILCERSPNLLISPLPMGERV